MITACVPPSRAWSRSDSRIGSPGAACASAEHGNSRARSGIARPEYSISRAPTRVHLCGNIVRVAHAANIPVLVDAAAELPPARNLRRFVEEGADLVAFSGGKGIGGPSASGILCGRRHLVGSALLQQLDLDFVYEDWRPPAQLIDKRELRGVPRHGIGRPCKVGKEQIAGLLTALLRFTENDDAARNDRHAVIARSLAAALPRSADAECAHDCRSGSRRIAVGAGRRLAGEPINPTPRRLLPGFAQGRLRFMWIPRMPTRGC